jgi:adenylosuccinate synthase
MNRLEAAGWFKNKGSYILVDGQYGSTGKGVGAAVLAAYADNTNLIPDWVISNAGPNSGHTAVVPDGRWVNKQIPIATSVLDHLGHGGKFLTYMNGGAVIDPEVMSEEYKALSASARACTYVHPHAAVVRPVDREANVDMVRSIASTGKGTGPAAAARILRSGMVYGDMDVNPDTLPAYKYPHLTHIANDMAFIETSQGFSLGINSGFYPHCTHRECTVAQAMADARVSPSTLRNVMMVVRTYPIRVGNTENSSGDCYPDQEEISWKDLGQEPEYTTVTKRVRRIFTWSRMQFREAMEVNRPDTVFLNFANYLKMGELSRMIDNIRSDASTVGDGKQPLILVGFGPSTTDVEPA